MSCLILKNEIPSSVSKTFKGFLSNSHSLYFIPVGEKEILDIISSLKKNSTAGCDDVCAKVVKTVTPIFCKTLAHIFDNVREVEFHGN